jgi:hypothetical protein
MEAEIWIVAILGIGVAFIGWMSLTIWNMKIDAGAFTTDVLKDIKSIKDDISSFKDTLKVLVDERRIIDSHQRDINELNGKAKANGNSIIGIETFLTKKHGAEFLDSYEKTQASIS